MTNSYIAINKETGAAVWEFYNPSLIEKINTQKYEILTALRYLQNINKRPKNQHK